LRCHARTFTLTAFELQDNAVRPATDLRLRHKKNQMIRIRQGLDIPIAGTPEQSIHAGPAIQTVGVLGRDYIGYKRLPKLLVKEGDRVTLGQPLVSGKHLTSVVTTAPGTGTIEYIGRGTRRFLETIAIRLDGDGEETFNAYGAEELGNLNTAQVRDNLLASGLWLSFRTRPYGRVANPDSEPHAIFVTAIDTNPLAADPAVILSESREDFSHGLTVISKLTPGKVFVCTAPRVPVPEQAAASISVAEFSGPHPAGLVGTHIHFLAPVSARRSVWHLNYQDVIAIGRLFTGGRLSTERIIALGGPMVTRPRLVRTRLGASTNDLVKGELQRGESRVISGSILSGLHAVGPLAYLGRYHLQLSVLREGRERELLGWIAPGLHKFSASRAFASSLFRKRPFSLTTTRNGSPRAMVPIGTFEQVMPLDILPTQLLRALVVEDTDTAQALGCLELDEEDLALCTFVDTGKYDYGPILRKNLQQIIKAS
jgi:Na+-transporting NADH:ubiquinone oxidoreductase subunit A